MSQYFQAGGQVLWNPSASVAQLFARTAEALVPVAGQPSGIGPAGADGYEVDVPALEAFVSALVRTRTSTVHVVLRSMLDGFLPTAVVLVQRAGVTVTGADEQLRGRAADHSRTMPQ